MLHVVPILCLILFIGLVEYRLKKHLDDVDIMLEKVNKKCTLLERELLQIHLKTAYEGSRNE